MHIFAHLAEPMDTPVPGAASLQTSRWLPAPGTGVSIGRFLWLPPNLFVQFGWSKRGARGKFLAGEGFATV